MHSKRLKTRHFLTNETSIRRSEITTGSDGGSDGGGDDDGGDAQKTA
jgi:hypothetical protein